MSGAKINLGASTATPAGAVGGCTLTACGTAPPRAVRSSWQIERVKLAHRICTRIAGRVARGHSIGKSFTYFAWYWRDRFYRTDPGRRVRLSRPTIIRLYYQWQKNGQTPDSLRLCYGRRGGPKLPMKLAARFR